jgi:hypothetical protein
MSVCWIQENEEADRLECIVSIDSLTSKGIDDAARLARRTMAWRAAWHHLLGRGMEPPLPNAELDRVTDEILSGKLNIA